MELGTLLILLLLLACPLMMVWMMRGHGGDGGHASHGAGHDEVHGDAEEMSSTGALDELRRRRAELDAEIAQLEQPETETKAPAAV